MDLIDRQEAIDRIETIFPVDPHANECAEGVAIGAALAKQYIETLPSAQPERMRGRWIIKDNPGTGWYRVTCSECGEDVTSTAPCIGFYPNAKVTWDYCPNCGADMREVDDERV